MERSFTVDAVYYKGQKLKFKGGRYISGSSSDAAKKAFSQIYRHYKEKKRAHDWYVIHMRETTQGSAHKIKKYKVMKNRVNNKVERDGVEIVYTYTTTVKAMK